MFSEKVVNIGQHLAVARPTPLLLLFSGPTILTACQMRIPPSVGPGRVCCVIFVICQEICSSKSPEKERCTYIPLSASFPVSASSSLTLFLSLFVSVSLPLCLFLCLCLFVLFISGACNFLLF